MSNLNRVLLMGRLTRDPELRYTPQGTAVSEIGLAINREYTVGTERRKETTFVDVTLWKRQAEVVCQYLKKGSPIFVEGRLSFDSWETPDGQKRSKLRVVAENFQFVGARGESDPQPEDPGAGQSGMGLAAGLAGGQKRGGPWTESSDPSSSRSGAPGARQGYSRVPSNVGGSVGGLVSGPGLAGGPAGGAEDEAQESDEPLGGPLGLKDGDIPF
jgi:single-strand DNA-binding protein